MNLFKVTSEYKKVQWPKKKVVIYSTIWVLVMSAALSIYLGAFDFIVTQMLPRLSVVVSRLLSRIGG